MENKPYLLVSRCLLGEPCRYDGKSKPCEAVIRLKEKYELIPVSLLRAHVLRDACDLAAFIPEGLDPIFTVKQYSKATKLRGMDAYSAVHSLCDLGLLREDATLGRAKAYSRNF